MNKAGLEKYELYLGKAFGSPDKVHAFEVVRIGNNCLECRIVPLLFIKRDINTELSTTHFSVNFDWIRNNPFDGTEKLYELQPYYFQCDSKELLFLVSDHPYHEWSLCKEGRTVYQTLKQFKELCEIRN